jgi:hypothetical protein
MVYKFVVLSDDDDDDMAGFEEMENLEEDD